MKVVSSLILAITLLNAPFGRCLDFPGIPAVDPEKDDFEVLIAPGKEVISVFHSPSTFHVILRNKTAEPQRLFEAWNSWGYQNISFVFYYEGTLGHWVGVKDQSFTRNFPSFYEVPPGETVVFPISLEDSWDDLPPMPEGKSKMKLQAVYRSVPSFVSKEHGVWTGIVASKVYDLSFWKAQGAPK